MNGCDSIVEITLCGALQGVLVEGLIGCFGECAPAQLESEPELTGVQSLTTIFACLNHLLDPATSLIHLRYAFWQVPSLCVVHAKSQLPLITSSNL